MTPSRIRYVTACQQLLALGAVLAALAPAAAVVSLDVIREAPTAGSSTPGQGTAADPAAVEAARVQAAAERRSRALRQMALRAETTGQSAEVPTTVVEPSVTEVPIGAAARQGQTARSGRESVSPSPQEPASAGTATVTSPVRPVTGYGAVGVTWASGTDVPEGDIDVEVRTRTDGTWSGWQAIEYHDDHAPDPGSQEARTARPGTDEALVGHVDDVQARVTTTDEALPADLSMAVIEPGTATSSAPEAPALDAEPAAAGEGDTGSSTGTSTGSSTGGIALRAAAATATPPPIYSRAQWGADERTREQGPPSYGTIKGGFVHHTVNANDYTADEVPGIIRSIYAYHVKSRGWRDIGYNFLVDKFGRIWEGRYGGIDKPVVGAHTSGYNDEAFAMSAIGNFDTVQPPDVMLRAYGALFGWKLGISGVSAAATNVAISGKVFASSIDGHRDAGQTACPGKYLYAQLPAIRTYAAAAQAGTVFGPAWTGRTLSSDLVGSPYPDVVVRRTSDGRGVLLPTGGLTRLGAPVKVSKGWRSSKRVVVSPDLTGDGRSDLVVVGSNGTAKLRAGDGAGRFGKTRALRTRLGGTSLLTPVGDLDRDGRNDLVGRTSDNRLHVYLGSGGRRFTDRVAKGSWKGYTLLVGPGDVTGDGRADLLARDRKGKLHLFPGTKKGIGKRSLVSKGWSRYDAIVGGGDYTGDGRADLVVRRAKTGDVSVLPGDGAGRFGTALGPVANLKGKDQLTGAQLTGGPAAELLARAGNKLVRLDNPGTTELTAPVETNLDLRGAVQVLNAGDLDRDGVGDVVTRAADGSLSLHPGTGGGQYAAAVVIGTGFAAVGDLRVVADRTGDGLPDLAGTAGGVATQWAGAGRGTVGAAQAAASPYLLAPSGTDLTGYAWVVPTSDGSGDGVPDVVVRSGGGLYLLPGGPKALGAPRLLGVGMEAYDLAG